MTQLSLFPPPPPPAPTARHHREFTSWRDAADHAKMLSDTELWTDISLWLDGSYHVRAVRK
ncbi:MAG: hypothetical protein LUQ50_15630 [Methanospirillum sp.]|uniref:hypothetical protein n=1 Tax=Methanospirillum sp. TaxID=45200 RepID=UPI0023735246|nr:hypothetical protein [Methanospirillum sp.]MDD1730485.1 hypothetical protein [Methanospirillum sp.]